MTSHGIVQNLWNYCNILRDDDLIKRDKASLDIFWLKDDSLEDAANLPARDVIAAEIVEDLPAVPGRVRPDCRGSAKEIGPRTNLRRDSQQ
jgi:hypothetical protein